MRCALLLVVTTLGCGRLGYERRAPEPDATPDAPVDATPDTPPDAPAVCPTGMSELTAGSSTCIEQTERGDLPWTDAKLDCESLGRRLCADAEWFLACTDATGMVDMIDGGYEWVAEEAGGIALKRGSTDCTVMSSHAVVDPYEYRCCAAKL